MSMTRGELAALELPEAAIDRILAMHEEAVAALTQERDAWREAAADVDALTQERNTLLEQVTALEAAQAEQARQCAAYEAQAGAEAAARRLTAVQEAVKDALLRRGANPKAVPLLLQCLALDNAVLEEGALADEAALLDPLAAQFPDFFLPPRTCGTPLFAPPAAQAALLTAEDVRHMSVEEINRNWQNVREVLRTGR